MQIECRAGMSNWGTWKAWAASWPFASGRPWAFGGGGGGGGGEVCDSCQCSHMSNTPMHDVHMLKVLVWTQ